MFEFMDLINDIIIRIPTVIGIFVILKWLIKANNEQKVLLKSKIIELKLIKAMFNEVRNR